MNNPLTDPYIVLSKVYSEGAYLKQSLASSPIEPLSRPRTSKICYGVLEKDVYLGHIIGANCRKMPKSAVRLILKIALYMLEFMGKHDYMVADCAVAAKCRRAPLRRRKRAAVAGKKGAPQL